ncbi:MAG TPA: bifunctional nuclease family protein [bacterium]|jgi:bifunctional DNase/RNase|nr:bifunctional nuclease family protein [bacterium]
MVEMRVHGLAVDTTTRLPVVILMDATETHYLPIWIGVFEADAILVALEEMKVPRPATHDLMKNLVQTLDAQLVRVVVHALDDKSGTYYANLILKRGSAPHEIEVDARPSDAIALALRLKAPIFAAEDVLARSAKQDKAKINKEMEDFRKFLADVKPGDFARYDRGLDQGPGPEKSQS